MRGLARLIILSLLCAFVAPAFAASPQVGQTAPAFRLQDQAGHWRSPADYHGHWLVLYFYPKDFTPGCTTEVCTFRDDIAKLRQAGAGVVGVSLDDVKSHAEFAAKYRVPFPLLSDADRKVSQLYDMIHPNANETLTVRSLFIIDPKKKVRLIITYPASTGRNFNEILRVIDSLQLTDNYSVATPVNWEVGEDVIISPAIKDEATLKSKFPKGYKEVRPYLRTTPQPDL